jgi:hypothetical protein
MFRFRLKKEDKWVVSDVKEIFLSRKVEEFCPQPVGERLPVAEGLSVVSDESGTTVIWIGLRTDGLEGKFRVLAYRSRPSSNDDVHFDFHNLHEFDVSPARIGGKHSLHLSGLYAVGVGSLAVLGTTEDDKNYYHGNVIYLVDTKRWDQIGTGAVFTPEQKAEGIVIWDNRIGIVYDNDERTVGEIPGRTVRRSSLQIFRPILPRRGGTGVGP